MQKKEYDILFLNAYYEPEATSDRHISSAIAEELANNCFRVMVRTPMPTRGIGNDVRQYYKRNRIEIRNNGNLTIQRFRLYKENKGFVQRAVRYFLMDTIHFITALTISTRCYFVDSTPPLHGVMTCLLSKIKKTDYVYFLQDVFPQGFVTLGILKSDTLIYKILLKWQLAVYHNAKKILVISDQMKEDLVCSGIEKNKIEVIKLWPDPSIKKVDRLSNDLFDIYELDRNRFYVVYGGNIGVAQNIRLLVDCAILCEERQEDISFVIFGDGSKKEELLDYVSRNGVKNVYILPMQPFEKVSEVYSLGDVATVICKSGTGAHNMPSKTWQIMKTGTPIVTSYDAGSDLNRIIENNNLGIACDADDVEAFYNAIKVLKEDKNKLYNMSNNCLQYVEHQNSRQKWTEKINIIMSDTIY